MFASNHYCFVINFKCTCQQCEIDSILLDIKDQRCDPAPNLNRTGLGEGDRVITVGQDDVGHGADVAIINEEKQDVTEAILGSP
ncbi:MAG: hypothetical protein GY775_17935 [Candidatus Scalindua sp.]|nr:hypothetical protein [Candidatus Scalindua sp.]